MNGAVNSKGYKKSIKKTIKMEARLRHYVTHGINQCARQSVSNIYQITSES